MRVLRSFLWVLVLVLSGGATLAMAGSPRHANGKYSAIIVDAESGRVLYSSQADSRRYPASLTKMMTLYLAFDALESGKLSKDTRLRVSKYAASRRASKLGLKVGSTIRTEDAILALVTKSANDAAAVLAEAISGSEARFSRLMTRKARSLGMSRTVFRNASGLPNRKQVSTARDMATLGRRLFRDYPQYYHYFSTESFTYQGRDMGNHNNLLGVYDGTDGIKTGYTNASGFNLVSSVRRNGYHLVGVVFGGKTAKRRDAHMIDILDRAFKRLPKRSTPQRLAANESPFPAFKPPMPAIQLSEPERRTYVIAALPRAKPERAQLARIDAAAPAQEDSIATLIAAQAGASPAPASIPIPRPAPRPARRIVSASASTAGILGQGAGPAPTTWGVQVGAFSKFSTARTHMLDLMDTYPDILSQAETAVQPYQFGGQTLFRARLEGLAEAQAWGVCKTLVAGGRTCIPVPPGSRFAQTSG